VSLELIEMINKLKAAAAEERGFARFAKLFAEQSHLRLRWLSWPAASVLLARDGRFFPSAR